MKRAGDFNLTYHKINIAIYYDCELRKKNNKIKTPCQMEKVIQIYLAIH